MKSKILYFNVFSVKIKLFKLFFKKKGKNQRNLKGLGQNPIEIFLGLRVHLDWIKKGIILFYFIFLTLDFIILLAQN